MNLNRALVVANQTAEGINVIDIDIYNGSGRKIDHPSKRFIDEINALPMLDRDQIKSIIARQYGVPLQNVEFD
jgi:hypothetical protein